MKNIFFKITVLASAVHLAFTSFSANALVDQQITAGRNQSVILTPGEQYTYTYSNTVLSAYNSGGKITGDNVSVIANYVNIPRVTSVLDAYNGGKIDLRNSDIIFTIPSSLTSRTDRIFSVKNADSSVNISDSTINNFAALGEISDGATGVLSNDVISVGRGVTVTGAGSRLDINDNSAITIRGDSYGLDDTGISGKDGATLNIENSTITVLDNGYQGSGMSGRTPPNPNAIHIRGGSTNTTHSNLKNLHIETKGYQSDAVHIVQGYVIAAIDALDIVTRGLGAYGVYIDNTKGERSSLSNSSIETFGYSGYGVMVVGNSQLTLENSHINTHGGNATGLAITEGGVTTYQGTIVNATNVDITMNGRDSTGVRSGRVKTYLDDIRLNMSGDGATGLSSGDYSGSEAVFHADRIAARLTGNNSTGMWVGGTTDVYLKNSSLTVTGASSKGVGFGYAAISSSTNMQIADSQIETQDGYAVQSQNANLNLELTGTTLTGRTGGNHGAAIGVIDGNGVQQSGIVNVAARDSSLIIGDAVSLSANPAALNLTLNSESSMTGRIARGNSMTLDDTSRWMVTGNSDVSTLVNSGVVGFVSPQSDDDFKTITVNDYHGGGTLIMNAALGDDDSPGDKLVVTGNTSGSTGVIVNNVHGSGALTTNGIEIIRVGGQSAGLFSLENRAVAGVYEYFLHQNSGNWYLRSEFAPEPDPTPEPEPAPVPEPTPESEPDPIPVPVPEPAPQPEPEPDPDQKPTPQPDPVPVPTPEPAPAPVTPTPVYRPESGGYLSNIVTANRLFSLRLKDREGYAENAGLWLRQTAHRNKSRDNSGQLRMTTNSYVIQGGGEIWHRHSERGDRLGVGMMAGYGHASGRTRSVKSHYSAKNQLNGYSVGTYATWYQDAKTLNGTYLDGWLQYNWFDATVNGERLAAEQYDIRGLSASAEAGYRIPVRQSDESGIFVTPQAQVVWSGMAADRHYETNKTRVDSSNGSMQTRLGVNVSFASFTPHTDRPLTVYGEVNWLHHTKMSGVIMDNVRVEQAGSRNIAELKLGAEGALSPQFDLWANVAGQQGSEGYRDISANLGLKYRF